MSTTNNAGTAEPYEFPRAIVESYQPDGFVSMIAFIALLSGGVAAHCTGDIQLASYDGAG